MSRIIFWLALVFLVIFAVRSKIREAQKRGRRQFRQPPPDQPSSQGSSQSAYRARSAEKAVADAETMLQCAHCGVYYPASENVPVAGRDYCSQAHAGLPAA